jgi:hypothetical protein
MPIIDYTLFLVGLAAIVVISYSKASFPVRILAVSLIALFVNRVVFG